MNSIDNIKTFNDQHTTVQNSTMAKLQERTDNSPGNINMPIFIKKKNNSKSVSKF